MTIETASYIDDLNPTYPARGDFMAEGDDHIRLVKQVLQNTLVNADSALDLSLIGASIIPIGGIILWASDTIPDGFHLCDGSTVARSDGGGNLTLPDLRGLFVRCANPPTEPSWYGGGSDSYNGNTGSAGNHTHSVTTNSAGSHNHGGATSGTSLSIYQMPAHSHGGGNHNHTYTEATGYLSFTGSGAYQALVTSTTQNTGNSGTIIDSEGSGSPHDHTIGTEGSHYHTASTASAGSHYHSYSVETKPPYLALSYIMKV